MTVMVIMPSIGMVHAHSMFNSAEEFFGGYRVQIATLPEFPQIDEDSQLLIRVTDEDFEEVEEMTIGIRVYFNEDQIFAVPPTQVEGAHFETNFVFESTGNHIVKVDLYNVGKKDILTYTFNISTQSPFGYIFIISITIGASIFAILVGYIYIPRLLKIKSRS
jgi:hypothetical protein